MPYRIFSLEEVAEYLHVGAADIDQLVRRDEIPFERQGSRLVFRQNEIDAWASRRLLGLSEDRLDAFHKKSSARNHDLSHQHAIVPELFKASGILPVLSSKTRASVVRHMVQLAESTGLVCYANELLNSVLERERLCSTALAGGVALLHPKNHEPYMFEDSFVVLGKAIQPVPFGSPDGATSDIFFLVCSQDDRIHLHVLARICLMCQRTSMLLEFREAVDAEAMYRILVKSEEAVIRSL